MKKRHVWVVEKFISARWKADCMCHSRSDAQHQLRWNKRYVSWMKFRITKYEATR